MCAACFVVARLAITALVVNPGLVISAPEYLDLDKLYAGENRAFRYRVKNSSGEDLKITEIKASCSCATIDKSASETWKFNEERTISGIVNFGLKRAMAGVTITISAKDASGHQAEGTTTVRGVVDNPIELSQSYCDFGSLENTTKLQSVTVGLCSGKSDWRWDAIVPECSSNAVRPSVEKISDSTYKLRIDLDPGDIPISTYRASVLLRLMYHGKPLPHRIPIAIVARITGPITANPSTVMLGRIVKNDGAVHMVDLESKGLDLNDLVVEKKPDFLSAKMVVDESTKARLCVALTSCPHEMVSDCILLLHPATGTKLSIPVLGIYAEPKLTESTAKQR